MTTVSHYPSPFSRSFSEAVRIDSPAGTWIIVSGQVGVPYETGADLSELSFEAEVRCCFERIASTLSASDAKLSDLVKVDVHLTDLSVYAEFGRVRAELFPTAPPASTAVQVAGLLLGARIEIGGVAFLPES
jgi:2-iminobutanoate/2-iminopropanoate deaminase